MEDIATMPIELSERFLKEYLSIIHDKMDKTKTSIPRLHVKSKSIVGTKLVLSLIDILTHGNKTRGFGHFSLPFVHMGSQFTITSLAKCLRDLEDPQIDMYGDLLYESGSSRNPLTNVLLYLTPLFTQNVKFTRMILYLMEDQRVKMLILKLFLHICCYSWTM